VLTDVLAFLTGFQATFSVVLTGAFVVAIVEWGVRLVTGRAE